MERLLSAVSGSCEHRLFSGMLDLLGLYSYLKQFPVGKDREWSVCFMYTHLCTIIYVVAMSALSLFLVVGGYILNRDKDWRRVWEELGKPKVKNIKELKAFIKSTAIQSAVANKRKRPEFMEGEPEKHPGAYSRRNS